MTLAHEISGYDFNDIPPYVLESDQPLILRGLVSHWPCVSHAHDSNQFLSYLRDRARDQAILTFCGSAETNGRFFYSQDLSGFNFVKKDSTLLRFLDALRNNTLDAPHVYMGSTSVDRSFPTFNHENPMNLSGNQALVSIWLGSSSTIAAHFDSPQNLACIAHGKRTFTLFPPDQLENLYVGPLDFTPAGQAISLVDFDAPDLSRFPRFELALQQSLVAELEAGDALLLPSMWWHHVKATGPVNALINYWWTTQRPMAQPLDALMHSIMAVKNLPKSQREAWQNMFEFYLFSEDVDFEHIPENKRGILGEIDVRYAQQLRYILKTKLEKS